ncbi:hypothetical protein TrCOL_g11289 [Triparma columacea]|uniref:Uncharacterized protein n=1 Tax=Triparma columacea TaxID=722753 RepID=A0A9W7FYK8_9STRA|nr:hypothetical protein TrCOL_g11289 [Triparma columacea]
MTNDARRSIAKPTPEEALDPVPPHLLDNFGKSARSRHLQGRFDCVKWSYSNPKASSNGRAGKGLYREWEAELLGDFVREYVTKSRSRNLDKSEGEPRVQTRNTTLLHKCF